MGKLDFIKWFSVGFLICALASCATGSVKLSAVPTSEQQIIYSSGIGFVKSCKQFSTVIIKVDPIANTVEQKICLFLGVKNTSPSPSIFSPENIHISIGGKPLKVFPDTEVMENVESKRRAVIALTTIVGGLAGIAAYNNASTSYQYGTIHGPGGYQATYYRSSYDPVAGMQAQAQVDANTSNQIGSINQSAYGEMKTISQIALKKQTIEPGQMYQGTIFFESPGYSTGGQRLTIEIDWNGETHSFLLDATNTEISNPVPAIPLNRETLLTPNPASPTVNTQLPPKVIPKEDQVPQSMSAGQPLQKNPVNKEMTEKLQELEASFRLGEMDTEEYAAKRNKILKKYHAGTTD